MVVVTPSRITGFGRGSCYNRCFGHGHLPKGITGLSSSHFYRWKITSCGARGRICHKDVSIFINIDGRHPTVCCSRCIRSFLIKAPVSRRTSTWSSQFTPSDSSAIAPIDIRCQAGKNGLVGIENTHGRFEHYGFAQWVKFYSRTRLWHTREAC